MTRSMKYKALPLAIFLANQVITSQALAQDDVDSSETRRIDEIVITASQQQIRSGIDAKTQAMGVADFIAADEFGQQADINLADSLRRLPGVSTEFDEDEGRYISVRGLPSRYTTVALNGSIIPDGWGSMSRAQNVEALPSFAIRRSGVYKSLTADLEGNAIGGYIDNTLVSAFDHDGLHLVTDARVGSHSYQKTPDGDGDSSHRGQFLISNQFGKNNQWGFMLAGYYFEKSRDQTKGQMRPQNFDSDRGYRVHRLETYDYSNTLARWSGVGRLEFRNDKLWTGLSYGSYDYQYDEHRYITYVAGRGDYTETPHGGSWSQGYGEMILDSYPIHTKTDFLLWDLEYNLNNGAELSISASHNEGFYELYEDASSVNFRTGDLDALGWSYDLRGQDSGGDRSLADSRVNDPSALLDASQYRFVGDFWPRADEEAQENTQLKIDYAYRMDDMGFGYKVGGLIRDFSSWVDLNRDSFYSPVDAATFPDASRFVTSTVYNPAIGLEVPLLNPDAFLDYFHQNPDQFHNDVAKGLEDITKADVSYDETVKAAYAMGQYRGENLHLVVGVRYEETDWDSIGRNNSDNNAIVYRDGSYSNTLPSIVGSYQLNDVTKLRFGYNQSIGRPDPSDLATRETVSENDDGNIRVSRGNAALKPREADNYDIALEFDLGDGEFVALGYFYKDLKNEIFTLRTTETGVNSFGDPAEIITTQPTNLSKASVQGVELTFINDSFDSLPAPFNGLGFSANVTWLEADLDVPMNVDDPSDTRNISLLNGSPRWKLNAALMYQLGNFNTRLTYAYSDDTRRSTSTSNPSDDIFELDYAQWDLYAGYRFNNGINVYVEGRNITNEARLRAYESGLYQERNEFGRSWWLGVSYRY